MIRHTLSYVLNHLPVKRDEIQLYARDSGSHVHNTKKCAMLIGGQFEYYQYKEITSVEADKRKLSPCPSCLMRFMAEHKTVEMEGGG